MSQLFAAPWTAAHQAPQSFIISWSLLRFMSIESVMPSNCLILSHPLLFLHLSQHQGLFQWVISASGGQSVGASASASVFLVNIQAWFPWGLTGLISLQNHSFDYMELCPYSHPLFFIAVNTLMLSWFFICSVTHCLCLRGDKPHDSRDPSCLIHHCIPSTQNSAWDTDC